MKATKATDDLFELADEWGPAKIIGACRSADKKGDEFKTLVIIFSSASLLVTFLRERARELPCAL